MGNENKAPRRTLLDDINELVGWYETHKPAAGRVLQIGATPQQLGKALGVPKPPPGKDWPDSYEYRGRTLVASK
jgi:hypothetical protein